MSTPAPDTLNEFRGWPVLAGLCNWSAAERPGHGVDEAVLLVKRQHWVLRRTWEILISRISCIRDYELKMAFSYHAHLIAEQVAGLRERVAEMREPPLGLEDCPDPRLDVLLDEAIGARDDTELLAALYGVILPDVLRCAQEQLDRSNFLMEAPTVRILEQIVREQRIINTWGGQALSAMRARGLGAALDKAVADYAARLRAAGGVDGRGTGAGEAPGRERSLKPFVYDPKPGRDERFTDNYNMGTSPEAMLYMDNYPARAKALMLLYKRLREIDVPEMMASIIYQTHGQPWGYYREMTRQLWDEARHAMMGQVGFRQLGLDWSKCLVRHVWSLELNTLLTPLERHGVLYYIEKSLMPKTGKRLEWEIAVDAEMPLLAGFQDYDWADEVLHARIGKTWYVPRFKTQKAASEVGEKAWFSIPEKRRNYLALGLTKHVNWWPEFYKHACETLGWEYDPAVAAYAINDYQPRESQGKVALAGSA